MSGLKAALVSTTMFPKYAYVILEQLLNPKSTTFPLRERSERVGLSACVKHGHVVTSKYCKWLPFD